VKKRDEAKTNKNKAKRDKAKARKEKLKDGGKNGVDVEKKPGPMKLADKTKDSKLDGKEEETSPAKVIEEIGIVIHDDDG